jgi:hypothetical protein
MESGLDRLVALVGRPKQPKDSVPIDSPVWQGPEHRLGFAFPADYKGLIATFGLHAWGGFLHVLNPATANEHLQLERGGLGMLGALHEVRRKYPDEVPFPLFPEERGLFPWGVTDNGDTLLWLTQGPSDWWPTVVLAARDPEREQHPLTMTALLAAFLVGELPSPLLLEPFGGEKPLASDGGWSA